MTVLGLQTSMQSDFEVRQKFKEERSSFRSHYHAMGKPNQEQKQCIFNSECSGVYKTKETRQGWDPYTAQRDVRS